MKAYREEVSDLKVKLGSLERALELLAGEFEREKREIREKALVSGQAGREDLGRLRKRLSAREREIARIKCLAGSVVEQRTELERFFHAALFQVRGWKKYSGSSLKHKW